MLDGNSFLGVFVLLLNVFFFFGLLNVFICGRMFVQCARICIHTNRPDTMQLNIFAVYLEECVLAAGSQITNKQRRIYLSGTNLVCFARATFSVIGFW